MHLILCFGSTTDELQIMSTVLDNLLQDNPDHSYKMSSLTDIQGLESKYVSSVNQNLR